MLFLGFVLIEFVVELLRACVTGGVVFLFSDGIDVDGLYELGDLILVFVIERMVIMSGERISVMDLPEEVVAPDDLSAAEATRPPLKVFRDQAERDYIVKALQRNGGNVTQAALELGIRRTYLHRRMAQLRIAKTAIFE